MKLEEAISQGTFRSRKHKAIVNLIYTFNWLYEKHTCRLKPYGLTIQQYNILRILRGQIPNPATVKLLKERMLDKMSDASRLVEKLRIKGLITRKICPDDRRNVDVAINEKGLKLLEKIDKAEDDFTYLADNLKGSEIDDLNYLLDKLRG
jgi:DNA-binding MarR family transcriptional regulator